MLILENAMRVLMAMVPDDEGQDAKAQSSKMWTQSSHLQPNELLGTHTIGEYLLNNKSVTNNLFANAKTRIKDTLLMTLFKSKPN